MTPDDGTPLKALETSPPPLLNPVMRHYPPSILLGLWQAMNKCGYVQKQGKNKFHDYKYAGEGHLLEVLRPAMLEAGLLLIPSGKSCSGIDDHGNTTVQVEYTLAHKDGAVWPDRIVAFGSGNDRNSKGGVGDKGLYKALTGANKYLLFKLFQIETGDDPEPASVADEAPPMEPPKKSNPGISKARTWVMGEVHDMNGCGDGEDLTMHLDALKAHYVRICREYPELWTGPDGSGLRGECIKVSTILQCSEDVKKWLGGIEASAKESAT